MNPTAISALIGLAVQAITAARTIGAAARAANPTTAEGTIKSDKEIIQQFVTDAKLGNAEATELLAWLATLTPPTP